jgi:hypothetical protein
MKEQVVEVVSCLEMRWRVATRSLVPVGSRKEVKAIRFIVDMMNEVQKC